MLLGSSWRFLKYCEKGAPSGVVGSCPRIAWPISSWNTALVVCKLVARSASKVAPTLCQKLLNFFQNPSQINQNGAHERSETNLECKSVPERPQGSTILVFVWHFGATCTILVAILDPVRRQGALKIEHFGTKSPKSQEK